VSLDPRPTHTLLMEGGPNDGLIVHIAAGPGSEPPEELRSAEDPLGGRYLRHPEPASRCTWTYRWVFGQALPDG
jgi:hypothetical protein